jgi:FkbM family methyltransferase
MHTAQFSKSDQIASAQNEVVSEFGEIYRDYGYDLFLLRLAAAQGFAPSCIYDIGGSSGIWSAVMQRVFPKATFEVFEPLAEESEDYIKMRSNHPTIRALFRDGRASLHTVALSDACKTCTMTVYPNAVGSTSIALDHTPLEARILEVPGWSLDDYTASHRLPAPDLLKIDTQGSELEILHGAESTLRSVSAILCECWLFRGYGPRTPLWVEVANFLREHDFHLFDFGWSYRRPSDQRIATEDMLFLRRGVPFSPLHNLADAQLRTCQ